MTGLYNQCIIFSLNGNVAAFLGLYEYKVKRFLIDVVFRLFYGDEKVKVEQVQTIGAVLVRLTWTQKFLLAG